MMIKSITAPTQFGWWSANGTPPTTEQKALQKAVGDILRPLTLVKMDGRLAVGNGGVGQLGRIPTVQGAWPIAGYSPACPLEFLGDRLFCEDHGIQFPYLAGAMANGIGSVEIVEAMSRGGMLGFFGAGGLSLERVEAAIDRIQKSLGEKPYGFNLIHSPNEPDLEEAVVDLYLRRGIKRVEASAFLNLTLPLVRYRVSGIHQDASGRVITPNRMIAKVSRVEVATHFFSPPPKQFLSALVQLGELTHEQAKLAEQVPMAQDLTAEADSGGHTDNRPAISLLPSMLALRDRLQSQYCYEQGLRVGAAGGISTPASAAASFAMGAAYVVSGSINQACVESGSSDPVRKMLAQAQQADVAMAPAGDMFEMGVKVQVLKRGTMFPMRAAKLYELYRAHESLDSIAPAERAMLEKQIFRDSLDEVWRQTRDYFLGRDPSQIERAEKDPKHKMALVFRSYLGLSSRWANAGELSRVMDYQIWCGPAMGAFNEWVKGSFLEQPENRRVGVVALNILYGAAVALRLQSLRTQGLRLPLEWGNVRPLDWEALQDILNP